MRFLRESDLLLRQQDTAKRCLSLQPTWHPFLASSPSRRCRVSFQWTAAHLNLLFQGCIGRSEPSLAEQHRRLMWWFTPDKATMLTLAPAQQLCLSE